MTRFSRFPSAIALAAGLSMITTPAVAGHFPMSAAYGAAPGYSVWDSDSVNVQRDRYRGHYRHNRVGTGDVIGGLLVIGAIAAIASAASESSRTRSYPVRDSDRPDNYRENRRDSRYGGGHGIDRAADTCVREIERDVRVNSVDSVVRSGNGWRVAGSLYNNDGFTCQIGQDGRIDDVTYGGRSSSQGGYSQRSDRQWTDDRYAAAWNDAGAGVPDGNSSSDPAPSTQSAATQSPAYPGGPLPGESYDDAPQYPAGQDDRYRS